MLAASVFVQRGPEYVDTIPPQDVIVTGSVDGSPYLLITKARTDNCGRPVTTVELVDRSKNLLGTEWNTIASEYGDWGECWLDPSRYLADRSLANDGGSKVGDSFVWTWAVHPDVTTVRITADDFTKDLKVHEVNGAGYALFEIPKDVPQYTSELLVDGEVVPGSRETHTVPASSQARQCVWADGEGSWFLGTGKGCVPAGVPVVSTTIPTTASAITSTTAPRADAAARTETSRRALRQGRRTGVRAKWPAWGWVAVMANHRGSVGRGAPHDAEHGIGGRRAAHGQAHRCDPAGNEPSQQESAPSRPGLLACRAPSTWAATGMSAEPAVRTSTKTG